MVLCYDVEDNRRRGRLQRRLKPYLLPVQKSGFEGELKHGLLDQVLGLVRRTVDLEVDTVRIYVLRRGCQASTAAGLTEAVG